MITALAAWWLAALLTLCERLARLPNLTKYGISTPILKPDGKPEDPLDRRNISVLSYLYRLWARSRRRDLKRLWHGRWRHRAHFSGPANKGAAEAWYERALAVGLARARGTAMAGGAVDVVKCYDELIRQVVVAVAYLCGMPEKILCLYYAFLQTLLYLTKLAGGYGQPR